jgi:hypothetical protein
MRSFIFFILLFFPTFLSAWETPQRGSDLRRDLADSLRPHAEQVFGTPVVFVIHDLRVDGNLGFGQFTAKRPNGKKITLSDLRPRFREFYEPDLWGGADIQALFKKSGRTWVAVHHAISPTDVWWADPFLCQTWAPVTPQACNY